MTDCLDTSSMSALRERIMRLHAAACTRQAASYVDPATGLMVLTGHYLEQKGYCCGSGCRHCPYPPEVQEAAGRPPGEPTWR